MSKKIPISKMTLSCAIFVLTTIIAKADCKPDEPCLRQGDGSNCPWIPQSVYKPDPSCGFNDAGVPNTREYQCGVKSDGQGRCEEHCIPQSCYTP